MLLLDWLLMLTPQHSKEIEEGVYLTGDRMGVKDRKDGGDGIVLLFFGLQVIAWIRRWPLIDVERKFCRKWKLLLYDIGAIKEHVFCFSTLINLQP
jgi:hypothetical protein